MKKIKESEEVRVCELYLSGMSMDKISRIYGTSRTPITRILKTHNIQSRDDSHKGRLYVIDESYFEVIDTANKAYILGLFYSDGMNKEDTGLVKIELQERDADIIYKIREELKSDYPIKKHELSKTNLNHRDTFCLQFVNRKMSRDLANLGVVSRKSLNLTFPSCVPKEYMRDFLRGYLDGDGHIRWKQTRFITLCSSTSFCESAQKYLFAELNIISKLYKTKNPNTKVLHIFRISQIKKFLEYLYKDSELYINRKYSLYLEICESKSLSA